MHLRACLVHGRPKWLPCFQQAKISLNTHNASFAAHPDLISVALLQTAVASSLASVRLGVELPGKPVLETACFSGE